MNVNQRVKTSCVIAQQVRRGLVSLISCRQGRRQNVWPRQAHVDDCDVECFRVDHDVLSYGCEISINSHLVSQMLPYLVLQVAVHYFMLVKVL